MKISQKVKKYVHDKKFRSEAKKRQQYTQSSKNLDLTGKKAVIFGVATDKSIAWSIAKTLNDNGCQVALGYQERVEEYIKELQRN